MHTPVRQKLTCFVDTETSGLSPTEHEILEFGAILETRMMGPQEVTFRMKPEHLERAEPKALEVNGYTPENWKASHAWSQSSGALAMWQTLGDAILIGHNVQFDVGFINETLKRHVGALGGTPQRVGIHVVDTQTLAMEHLVPIGLQSLKLGEVCKFLGIPPGNHTALGDARACRTVYYLLRRADLLDRMWWRLKNLKKSCAV